MSASLYQGSGDFMDVVGSKVRGSLPKAVGALKQGSQGPTMSDLQMMQQNERKQHEQAYLYEHGHNDGSAPLGTPSF